MKLRKLWLGAVSIIYLAIPLGALVGMLLYVDYPDSSPGELFLGLHKVALGGLMLYFFNAPERAKAIILAVVALELAWVTAYVVAFSTGSIAMANLHQMHLAEIALHVVVGATGLLVLRSSRAPAFA